MICGNVNIWKCASAVPLSTIATTKIIVKVLAANDLPAGILTMVVGSGRTIGERLIQDPRINLISFTGSSAVGQHVSEVVRGRFGRTILELGGNNATIVMKHADQDVALTASVCGNVDTAGQRCTSLRRLLLHEGMDDDLIAKLMKAYSSIPPGDSLGDETWQGPVPDTMARSAGASAYSVVAPVTDTPLPVGSFIVVTGGAGFIGHHTVRALVDAGYRVRVADDLSRGLASNLDNTDTIEVMYTNLSIPENAEFALEGADAVIHLAACVGGCPYVFSGDGTTELRMWIETERVDGSVIAAVAKSSSIRTLIYAATACSYPRQLQEAPLHEAVPIREADLFPANPESGYGWAKLSGELKVKQLARIKTCRVVRLHNVYGPGMRFDDSAQVVPDLVHRGLTTDSSEPLAFGGSGEQFRDFLHVSDVTSALMLALHASCVEWPSGRSIPFGTGEGTTIQSLAEAISHATGHGGQVMASTMVEGDHGRLCDTTEAGQLGWHATVSMKVGIASVVQDIQARMSPCLAVGLPLTSRGMKSEEVLVESLKEFAAGLPAETHAYIAIDDTDEMCASKPDQWYADVLGVPVTLLVLPEQRPFPVYHIYNQLFRRAYDDGMEFFVLLGDDVRLSKNDWLADVRSMFRQIQHEIQTRLDDAGTAACSIQVPFGVGVVAIPDDTSPGFPSFPVVHRWHADMMGGRFCPDLFINQDADPWVWEVYRRIGAAVFMNPQVLRMSNTLGGALSEPRYDRVHVDWKFDVIDDYTTRVLRHLGFAAELVDSAALLQNTDTDASVSRPSHEHGPLMRVLPITLDVVIPSYRVDLSILRCILSMKVPDDVCTLFIIVVDNPGSPHLAAVQALEAEPQFRNRVRVRVQPRNMGVSEARNRGIRESSAQWILFMDDDVTPSSTTISTYATAIRSFGAQAAGFVGPTKFPPPKNIRCAAVQASYLTYFWELPARSPMASPALPEQSTVPWGVTANLLLRRTKGLQFDPAFPRTGGGEDIAACLDLQQELNLPLVCVPSVDVVHPWWDRGSFSSWRFFAWTQGDGLLMDMYPEHKYRCPPNAVELTAFILLAAFLQPLYSLLCNGTMAATPGIWMMVLFAIWITEFAADAYVTLTDESAPGSVWAQSTSSSNFTCRLRRIATSMLSTTFKNHVEIGHLWIQLKRRRWSNVCARFDWHCGQFTPGIGIERKRALIRLSWMAFIVSVQLPYLLAGSAVRGSDELS